jgi:branched-chain amino acid transport system ATP-binding protein
MCTDPTLICLDEPAAGLNPHETEELAEKIQALLKDHRTSVLLIEHDMGMVMNICEQIVVLDHGEIIAQGSPTLVKNNQRVIKAYLGVEDAA